MVNVTLLSLRSFGFLQLRTSTSFTLFFSFTNSTLGVQAKKTQGVEQPLLFALMRSASRTYDARVSPPQCTSIRDVSFYNIFQLSAILCKWMLSHYHMIFPYECIRIMGSYPIKYKYPLALFFCSARSCVSKTNQKTRVVVSPLSSWTSIKVLSSKLVKLLSPLLTCVCTELSSDYFCMENLGTLSPKLTLYWCPKKCFIPSSF